MGIEKFTPGEWQIKESKGFGKEVWRSIFPHVVFADSYTRTRDGESECVHGVRIREADANLIVASKDLYRACGMALLALDERTADNGECWDALVAALKKADGEKG